MYKHKAQTKQCTNIVPNICNIQCTNIVSNICNKGLISDSIITGEIQSSDYLKSN